MSTTIKVETEEEKDIKLCEWLRQNSSGIYRPSAEAASRIEQLKEEINKLKLQIKYNGKTV